MTILWGSRDIYSGRPPSPGGKLLTRIQKKKTTKRKRKKEEKGRKKREKGRRKGNSSKKEGNYPFFPDNHRPL